MIDFKLTEDGELVIDANGDLATVSGDEQIVQSILFRLKTTKGDWVLDPNLGCSLEDFIGSPNIQSTWSLIEQRVEDEIGNDSLVISPEVTCIPVDDFSVMIIIEFSSLESDERIIQIQSGLDLRKGLIFSRTGFRSV